jgi:hypothetical protein
VLGAAQKQWFKDQLLAVANDPDVAAVFWFNSIAWNGTASADAWAAHPNERLELATFMDENNIPPKLFILCGDSHAIALDDGSNTNWAADGTGPATPTMIGAAIDRPGSSANGTYSHGVFSGSGQYGYVSIDDAGGDTIAVTLSGRTYNGSVLTSLTKVVSVGGTEPPPPPPPPPFATQSGSTLTVSFGNGGANIVVRGTGGDITVGRGGTTLTFTEVSLVDVVGSAGDDVLDVYDLFVPMAFTGGGGGDVIHVLSGTLFAHGDLGGGGSPEPSVFLSGGARATFDVSQHLAGLNIADGATATFFAGGSHLYTRSLEINGDGVLDLADNDLLVDYTGANPYATIFIYVITGRRSGTSGIISLPREEDRVHALADNAEWSKASFHGISIDATTIVAKYTYFGDGNLDGAVTGDDYVSVDANLGSGDSWLEGDFNFSGTTTGDDYVAIDANLGNRIDDQ